MRVLVLQKIEAVAGSERYLLNLLPRLASRGLDVTFLQVIRPADEPNTVGFVRALSAAGVSVRTVNYERPLTLPLLRRIRDEIRGGSYDLVHSNLIHADVWAAIIKLLWEASMRLVSTKHGYDEGFQTRHGFDASKVRWNGFSLLTRFAATQANHIVSVSDGLRRMLIDAKLVPKDRISTIPLGLAYDGSRSTLALGQARFGSPQLIIVGRLVPVKQHHLVFQILPSFVQSHPDIKLVIVGGGPLDEELRRKSTELGLRDHVVFTGPQENVHDYMRDSDLVLVPSSSEGFGAVILEGWYNEKPVVAFDVPAPNEIITDKHDGILVPPFDVGRLQREISTLLDDEGLRVSLGKRGREKYQRAYRPDAMLDATVQIYEEVLASPR